MIRCWYLTAAAVIALSLCACQASGASLKAHAAARSNADGLHVRGNRLLDGSGHVVELHGVNRSGTEYACVQGWGIFDGPSNKASVAAMAKWHINFVRIPLNEDCWLGINGVKRKYSGARYVRAIVNYVNLLHSYGIYAELSLMWGAPGTAKATFQPDAPDKDHSPAMWASMARTFRNDSNVILAPWGETTVSASCFLHGCRDQATLSKGPWDGDKRCGSSCYFYTSAGMDQAVRVMRRAGYTGIISIPGIDYANDLTAWLRHEPSDPLHQIVAEAHVYQGQICSTISCFDKQFEPVAKRVPLIWGETGQTNCGSSWVGPALKWAIAHNVGYAAWTWDAWGNCEALIKNYSGTPANAFGALVRTLDLGLSLPAGL